MSPSRSSTASWIPVEAPEGTEARKRPRSTYEHDICASKQKISYPFQCKGRPRRWGYRASRRSKKTRWSHDEPLFSLCVHRHPRRAAYLACVDLCDGHRQRYKTVVVSVVWWWWWWADGMVGGKRKGEKRSVYTPTTISHGDYLQSERATSFLPPCANDLGASTQESRLG